MDLALLLRAVWSRRVRILLAGVLAAAAGCGYALLLTTPADYAATDVTVFPTTDVGSTLTHAYALQPDRWVASQIAILSSPALEAQVGAELHMSPGAVAAMTGVEQLGSTDVVRVTAVASDQATAVAVASRLAGDYVAEVTTADANSYRSALSSLDAQRESAELQITAVQDQIARLGQSDRALGPLQTQLTGLTGDVTRLATERQQLALESSADPTRTALVGAPVVGRRGRSLRSSVLFGGVLGLVIAASWVALAARPDLGLETMDADPEFAGVPILGIASRAGRLTRGGARRAAAVRTSRLTAELAAAARFDEPVVVAPAGRERRVRHTLGSLAGVSLQPWPDTEGPSPARAVVAIDAAAGADRLSDAIGDLRAHGVDVVALIGVR